MSGFVPAYWRPPYGDVDNRQYEIFGEKMPRADLLPFAILRGSVSLRSRSCSLSRCSLDALSVLD